MHFVGQEVFTPYGQGNIINTRHYDVVVKPSNWYMACGQTPTFYLNPQDVKPVFNVGDKVSSTFGFGVITEIRQTDSIYVVTLENWFLATGKSPVLYLQSQSLSRRALSNSIPNPTDNLKCLKNEVNDVIINNPQDVKPVFKVGDKVSSIFGSGVINEIRQTDSIYVVTLENWFLATGKSPVLYLQSQSFSHRALSNSIPKPTDNVKCLKNEVNDVIINNPQDVKPVFKVGDKVSSIFGSGVIIEIRQTDSIYVVTLENWFLATGKSPVLYLQSQSFTLQTIPKPSNIEKCSKNEAVDEFPVNSLVKTIFGVGIIKSKRPDGILVVESTDWKLANNKNPIFYLQSTSLTKYTPTPKKGESMEEKIEADIMNRIAKAISFKNEGNASFKNKNLTEAKRNYIEALSFIQNINNEIKKEQRASIFELMITCSNNIALCSLREKQYSDVTNHAKTSLHIIEAIEDRLDGKVWQALQLQGVTLSTLKKTWKRKCLYLLGKAEYSQQNYDEAKTYLQSALSLIEGDSKLQKDIEELRDLLKEIKKVIREISKKEKKRWSAAFQKNTEDGKEEEKIANEIVKNSNLKIPSSSSAPANKGATTSSAASDKNKSSSSASGTVSLPMWSYLSAANPWLLGLGGVTCVSFLSMSMFYLLRRK